MNILELALKPRITKDSFKPIWLKKLYGKVIVYPCIVIHIFYAAIKYDGHIMYDQTIRDIFITLWKAGGSYRIGAYKILDLQEEFKKMAEKVKQKV